MKKNVIIFALICAALALPYPAFAQGGGTADVTIIGSTMPVMPELKTAARRLLAQSPPADTPYYIITYAAPYKMGWMVSVAGANLDSPDDDWSLTNPTQVAWMGSLYITWDEINGYNAEYLSAGWSPTRPTLKRAAPNPAPGGGPEIAWPWEAGKSVLFGGRDGGVHDAGYGKVGFYAVDLIMGDDLGTNIAPAAVYASKTGTVDYICADGNSTAVGLVSSDLDYFLYAHFDPSSSFTYGQEFTNKLDPGSGSSLMGYLRFGSFDPGTPDCGWAQQLPNHAHVHWVFLPVNGYFQVENCVISVADDTVTCGTDVIRAGGYITGGRGMPSPEDPPPPGGIISRAQGDMLTFYDYILIGVSESFRATVADALPEHNSSMSGFVQMTAGAAQVFFRVAYVLLRGQINITPLIAVLTFWMGVGTIWAGIQLALLILKAIRLIKLW